MTSTAVTRGTEDAVLQALYAGKAANVSTWRQYFFLAKLNKFSLEPVYIMIIM